MKFQRSRRNWIQGVSGKYSVSAKVFPEPSGYGIQNDVADGHISKIEIKEDGDRVFSYDRQLNFNYMDSDELNRILQQVEGFAKTSRR